MYNTYAQELVNHSGFEQMSGENSDEQNKEVKPPRSKAEPLIGAPLSDSHLTAAQRTAREMYQPQNIVDRSIYESTGDLAALLHSKDVEAIGSHAAVRNLLSSSSAGLENFSQYEVQRGFTGGGERYMLGAEFAVVAIIAMAGFAKRRTDLSYMEMPAVSAEDEKKKARAQQADVIYQSPKLKGADFAHGLSKDVPDWLISLDSSAAKEEGYLFGSVLMRPTVLMTMSDTFVALAETHFRDAVLAWLIVDLNKMKVTETWKGAAKVVAISNGETIELPVWEDIVEFYQSKPKHAKSDNLLTVVLKRNLDRELIEAALAAVIVPGSTNGGADRDS